MENEFRTSTFLKIFKNLFDELDLILNHLDSNKDKIKLLVSILNQQEGE